MCTTHQQEAENQPDRKRAKLSQDNARDIVQAIDNLIKLRLEQNDRIGFFGSGVRGAAELDEPIELVKRRITDYLLVTDPRAGVFRTPE